MTDRFLLARAKARSWWRRARGKPDTLAQFAQDLGFVTRSYTINLDHGDVDGQIRAVVDDIVEQVFPPRHPPRP